MGIWSVLETWSNRARKTEVLVRDDADSLLEIWGETAHDVAANLSWREDAGLLRTSIPGHWGRVHQEIGRRLQVSSRAAPGRIAATVPDSATTGFHDTVYRSPLRAGAYITS